MIACVCPQCRGCLRIPTDLGARHWWCPHCQSILLAPDTAALLAANRPSQAVTRVEHGIGMPRVENGWMPITPALRRRVRRGVARRLVRPLQRAVSGLVLAVYLLIWTLLATVYLVWRLLARAVRVGGPALYRLVVNRYTRRMVRGAWWAGCQTVAILLAAAVLPLRALQKTWAALKTLGAPRPAPYGKPLPMKG